MKKQYLLASFVISSLLIPVLVNAATVDEIKAQIQSLLNQITSLQAQLNNLTADTSMTTTASTNSCPNLYRTLSRGSRGSDVISLQQFLIAQELLNSDSVTGFFGSMTEAAVQRWQAQNSIISYGDAISTGYGVIGVRTRAAIAAQCGTRPPAVQTCPIVIPPQCSNGTVISLGVDQNGCNLGYQCKAVSVTCPNINPPQCTNGTLVSNGTDTNGCSLGYTCKPVSCPTYNACPIGYTTNTSTDANGCTVLQCNPPVAHATLNLPAVLSADSCAAATPGGSSAASITDQNNSLVSLSKQAMLALGIGDQYFQNHFQFICAQNVQGDNLVRWKYTIGEFATTLDDMVGFYTDSSGVHYKSNFSQDFGTPLVSGSIGEVSSVITKQAAADAMQACIGDFTDAHMYLGNPTTGGFARPLLRATPAVNGTYCPGGPGSMAPCLIKTGWIDLTTGKCTKNF